MQANPVKFQVLAVGKKTYDKNPSMHIQNSDLTCEQTVKLLGIEMDYQLNFDARALSCTFSSFFEFFSVQKCHVKGQKLKLLRIKE
jgi:hypothetical protein